MRNMMSQIQLKCPFENCDEIVTYDNFKTHQKNCGENPDPVENCAFCDQPYQKSKTEAHQNGCLGQSLKFYRFINFLVKNINIGQIVEILNTFLSIHFDKSRFLVKIEILTRYRTSIFAQIW